MILNAKLARHHTLDGVSFVKDDVPIGTKYKVDSTKTTVRSWYNIETGKFTSRESVFISGNGSSGWVPAELLDIEGQSQAN